jgi:hypothetical protein
VSLRRFFRPALALGLLLALAPDARAQVMRSWLRVALNPVQPTAQKGPSTAVIPAQTIGLRFSHQQHTAAGVDCTQCHDAVEKSRFASDRNIPAHGQCEQCHDIDAAAKGEASDPPSSCVACHPGVQKEGDPVPPDVFPANNLHFPHAVHLAKGAKCTDCHAGIEEAELGTRAQLPKMAQCLQCHDGQQAPNKCTTCHLSEPDGVLRTRFASGALAPSGTLRDDDHGHDFLRRHAHIAAADMESCSSCHRATECEACHTASSKAFRLHPPDWLAVHGVSARSAEIDCTACHREQSFCVSCHQQMGVASESRLPSRPSRTWRAAWPATRSRPASSATRRPGPSPRSIPTRPGGGIRAPPAVRSSRRPSRARSATAAGRGSRRWASSSSAAPDPARPFSGDASRPHVPMRAPGGSPDFPEESPPFRSAPAAPDGGALRGPGCGRSRRGGGRPCGGRGRASRGRAPRPTAARRPAG